MLWRKHAGADEGIGAYARVAPWLPDDRYPLDFYAAGGFSFKGLLPGRGADIFAVGASYAHVSDSLRGAQANANRFGATPAPLPDHELGVEATYQIAIAPWWKLQPDFQYLFHPGGSSALADAVVVGLRTQIRF